MIAVELRFLANRYHGTAWGRHVNEGVAEWPPSPYRLLRALYDAWKRKCADIDSEDVRRVFETLASTPPSFRLPRAIAAHTRSYLNSNTEDPSDKSLIFDGFLALAPEASCFMEWDLSLPERDQCTLAKLLSTLNYLGRSESWIEARLVHRAGSGIKCSPLAPDATEDATPVACAVPATDFNKRGSWLDALAYSTGQMLKDKASQPPAMRYVPYRLPTNSITTWMPMRSTATNRNASAAILQLQGRVLPMEMDAIRVAERIRGRLMRYFERRHTPIPAMLHGKDENGVPLKTKHLHLFILPRANRLGRIDHVLLFTTCQYGFAPGLADAISQIRQIVWIEPMRAALSWMGHNDDPQVRPLARVVRSSTPFVTGRHWRKGRGSVWNFVQNEIRRECANHSLPCLVDIRAFQDLRPNRFRRNREGDPSLPGYDVEITFAEDIRTPFALGYGCHFGLGQFEKA